MSFEFDAPSYAMGYKKGYNNGEDAGTGNVVIESGIICTDDGEGNITITVTEDKNGAHEL